MSDTKVVDTRKIPDFIGFCVDQKWELPYPEIPEHENRIRTAAKDFAYPPLYANGQYPFSWRVPYAADAWVYHKNKKEGK